MRIGVNASRLAGQRLGVARYIEYLVKHWATQVETRDDVVLFLREPLRPGDPPLPERFGTSVLRPALTRLAWENTVLPRAARGLDVLFCPSYTAPLAWHGRYVVAIHSMNEVESGTHPWWYRFTYTPLYSHSATKATRVILPSQSTLDDIRDYYGIPEEKLVVVPLGADPSFRPIDEAERLSETRRRYLGEDRPFILFVGKLSQRRNIPILISAFAEAKRRAKLPHSLLLFGPNHLGLPLRELAEAAGVADAVVQDDGVIASHEELALVYSAADLFVSASSYEGFSLPLVEALSCGRPSVVVDTSALAEIAGGASLLVHEPSTEALADGIERALTDDELRRTLSAAALERADHFRWEETARRTLDVLREAAEMAA